MCRSQSLLGVKHKNPSNVQQENRNLFDTTEKKKKKKKDLLHLKYLCKEEESLNKLSAVLTFHDSLCVNRAYLLVSCN